MPWTCWWSVSKPARGWTPLSSGWRRICRKAAHHLPGIASGEPGDRRRLERPQALKNLGKRPGSLSLVSLCNILIQSDRFGTSISQALKTESDYIRTTRRQKLESLAAKTPVKLLFPMLLFIFPAIMVVILGPAIIRLSEFFSKGG